MAVKKRVNVTDVIAYIVLSLGGLIMLYPVVYVFLAALYTAKEFNTSSIGFIPWPKEPTLKNYEALFFASGDKWTIVYIKNSLLRTIYGTVFAVLTSLLSGYVFARLRFRGKNVVFLIVLSTQMIPSIVGTLPMFLEAKFLNLYDTWGIYILLNGGLINVMGMFLVKQSIESTPVAMEEAAKIDGAGTMRIIFSIILPLIKTVLAYIAITTAIGICGIKYFYHCRGDKGGLLYNWESPSGSRVLAYREPEWYNADVSADFFLSVPGFTAKYAVSKALKVYGVGDHGGGATRKDLDMLLDIATWPIMPKVEFSSYHEFFKQFDLNNNDYEVVTGELNYIFDGCYTSQSRIKAANKCGEKFLKQVGELGAFCYSHGIKGVNTKKTEEAWKIQLFNHFHDIIPGSGVFETTEYAMGQAQVRDAILGCENTSLLKRLATNVETKRYGDGFVQKTHMGTGIGFYTGNMVFSGSGDEDKMKIFMLYNPSLYSGIRCYEITIWDCFADTDIVTYDDKMRLEHAFIDNEAHEYWGHKFRRMYVAANVPPKGYKCIFVKRQNEYKNYVSARLDLRKQDPPYFVLENEYICALFDGDNGALLSLKDKKRNETLSPNAGFNFVKEGTQQGMNAWLVGSRKEQTRITSVSVSADLCVKNELFQTFGYRAKFADSDIQVRYILKRYSPFLEIETTCNFNETGKPGDYIPALEYEISANTKEKIKYAVPFGLKVRDENKNNQVSDGMVYSRKDKIMLLADGKYAINGERDLSKTQQKTQNKTENSLQMIV